PGPQGGAIAEPGPRSRPGFEIRYNATVALARRGSDQIKDRLPVLAEMLDEELQLRNPWQRVKEGKLVPYSEGMPDAVAARTDVESSLKAIVELHRKRPDLDLSELDEPIRKLTQSSNEVLRQEAQRTLIALGKS